MGFKRRFPRKKTLSNTVKICMYVTYRLTEHTWGSLDDKIDEVVGVLHSGSGTGLRGRDLDYWFDNVKALLVAVKRVKALNLKGVEIGHDTLCSRCKGEGRISTRVCCPNCSGTGEAT